MMQNRKVTPAKWPASNNLFAENGCSENDRRLALERYPAVSLSTRGLKRFCAYLSWAQKPKRRTGKTGPPKWAARKRRQGDAPPRNS